MNRKNLGVFARLDGLGNIIPGSLITRPRMPKDGKWIQLGPLNYCCNEGECLIIFTVDGTASDITSIQSADNSISWTGTLDNGEYKAFIIPNCYNQEITLTMSAPGADIEVNASVVQGDGTIDADPDAITAGASPVTSVITTSAGGPNEYLVVVADA